MKRALASALLAAAAFALAAPPAAADYRRHGDYRHHRDFRAGHDHRGARIGVFVDMLPFGFSTLAIGGYPYYYSGGWYYRRYGRGYVIVNAPIGAVVGTLPPGYAAVWVGPREYYLAYGTYYAWDPALHGYVVVADPTGVPVASPPPAASAPPPPPAEPAMKLFIYPNLGQSSEVQARDRYQCHAWAVKQTGYDPSTGQRGTPEQNADYRRAITACLTARHYTVE